MLRPDELPRVLTAETARRLGVSRAHVRTCMQTGRWRLLTRGVVLTRPDAPTRADWAAAGLAIAGPHAALSGWDAIRLVGLGSAIVPSDPVLVLTRHGPGRVIGQARLRRVHTPVATRITSADDPSLPLIRVAMTARAVVDTALTYPSLNAVRALVGRSVQSRSCSVDELVRELSQARRRDSAHLRRALDELGAGVRSAAEADAVALLRRADVPPFEVNAPILDGSGRILAVADVLWRRLRAVLEIDSVEFHFRADDWRATLRRHNRLVTAGYAVTHHAPSEMLSPGWATEISRWLRCRAVELAADQRRETGTRAPPAVLAP